MDPPRPRARTSRTAACRPSASTVRWELARDERFRRVVRRGNVHRPPRVPPHRARRGRGLDADRVYYYRFRAGSWISPAGRTRTAPAAGAAPRRCASPPSPARRTTTATSPPTAPRRRRTSTSSSTSATTSTSTPSTPSAAPATTPTAPSPTVFNHETVTLEDYRLRYALYKSDPDLQAAHAAHPFVVTWDDHETENNYADDIPENGAPPEEFLLRRAAAYRAYWENHAAARAPAARRAPTCGSTAGCTGAGSPSSTSSTPASTAPTRPTATAAQCPGRESDDPARTMHRRDPGALAARRLAALDARCGTSSRSRCTFSPAQARPRTRPAVSMDAWDGYRGLPRRGSSTAAQAAGVENLMVLTGDVHVAYAFDIKDDFDDPGSRTLGTEIVATSVASGGDGADKPANWDTYTAANPHMKFYNGLRGYVTVELGRERAPRRLQERAARDHARGADHDGRLLRDGGGEPGLTPA